MEKYEIRSFGGDAAPKLTEERTIEGYAAVYNQRSEVLYDFVNNRRFIEVIEPGAFTEELIQNSDVRALIEHSSGRLLARSRNGKGTLALEIDDYGLKYRFVAPNTEEGNYAAEMIKRGDISGSSFAYRSDKPGSVVWEKQDNNIWLRKVLRIDKLYDVTITAYPAYTGTEVTVRSIEELEKPIESINDDYLIEIYKYRKLI